MAKALWDFGLEDSFRLAAVRLHSHYGFSLAPERIRQATLGQCEKVAGQLDERAPVRHLPCTGAEAIATQCDGSMVCTVQTAAQGDARKQRCLEWKEARLCAAQSRGQATIHYEGGIVDVHRAGELWGLATAGAGWAAHTHLQPMGDGAGWIQEQAAICFPGAPFVLDLYHVLEYLWAAAETCAQKESPGRWCRRQKNKLLKGKAHQLIDELEAKSEPLSVPEEQAPVRIAHRYLAARAHQLDYPRALAQGLPVGTGMIESAHKQIIQKRLKGPGMAWLPQHAHLFIQARAKRATQIQNPKCQLNAA